MPLSRPLLAMLLLALAGGLATLLHGTTHPRADLEVWAFSPTDVARWSHLARLYEKQTGQTVAIREVSARAIDTRLLSLFMSNQTGPAVPDLVTIEIGSVGKYFRPPASEVGFLPLDSLLHRDHLDHTFLPARLAPWTKSGHLFGIPLDVHPVSITYRRDLFTQAGIDLSSAKTWPDFQRHCLDFQHYWSTHGHPRRTAIELPPTSADVLYMMLLQRGINLVTDDNQVHLDHPLVAETLAFYAQLVAGPRKIGDSAGGNTAVRVRSLADGDVCALVTPDWQIPPIRDLAAHQLTGKLAMMPLPTFSPSDHPTSTWGGSMLAIPHNARNPEAAWALLKFLLLSEPQASPASPHPHILLPAIPSQWTNPSIHLPDPLYANQPIGTLYTHLAASLPARQVTPFTALAIGQLSRTLHHTTRLLHPTSPPPPNLPSLILPRLTQARHDLERYIQFGTFSPPAEK